MFNFFYLDEVIVVVLCPDPAVKTQKSRRSCAGIRTAAEELSRLPRAGDYSCEAKAKERRRLKLLWPLYHARADVRQIQICVSVQRAMRLRSLGFRPLPVESRSAVVQPSAVAPFFARALAGRASKLA